MKKLLTMFVLAGLSMPCLAETESYSDATYISGRNVYIRLIKQTDGWHFSDRLSLSPSKNDGNSMDVLLNDLTTPTANRNDHQVRMECIPIGHCSVDGITFAGRKEALDAMVTPTTGPFYKAELNVGSTLFSNTVGVLLTMGITAGANENAYSFDRDAFGKAIGEAIKAENMTDARRQMLIETIGVTYAQAQATKLAAGQSASTKKIYSRSEIEAGYKTQYASVNQGTTASRQKVIYLSKAE